MGLRYFIKRGTSLAG